MKVSETRVEFGIAHWLAVTSFTLALTSLNHWLLSAQRGLYKHRFLLFHWASFQATLVSLLYFPDHVVLCKSGKVPEIHALRATNMFSSHISSISYLAPKWFIFPLVPIFLATIRFALCEAKGKPGMLPTIRGYHLMVNIVWHVTLCRIWGSCSGEI